MSLFSCIVVTSEKWHLIAKQLKWPIESFLHIINDISASAWTTFLLLTPLPTEITDFVSASDACLSVRLSDCLILQRNPTRSWLSNDYCPWQTFLICLSRPTCQPPPMPGIHRKKVQHNVLPWWLWSTLGAPQRLLSCNWKKVFIYLEIVIFWRFWGVGI